MINEALFIFGLLLIAIVIWFVWARAKALLLFFQQEEYDAKRFIRWWAQNKAFDRAASIQALVALIFLLALPESPLVLLIYQLVMLSGLGLGIQRSRAMVKQAKKPLVMTRRAGRIFAVHVVLMLILLAGVAALCVLAHIPDVPVAVLATAQAAPFLLVTANGLLSPLERSVKARLRREAEAKLRSLNPTIIAMTGSFGKTSLKHILAHILGSVETVLATPGSVNTVMGITRVVREQLTAEHRYFLAEMGAYGPGSIADLCRLAPPDLAAITAVGHAHYERFKTLETVGQAKFEIAQAAHKKGGACVIATDGVPDHIVKGWRQSPCKLIEVGRAEAMALRLLDWSLGVDGLRLQVQERDTDPVALDVPLYGQHQIDNILVAVALARQAGLPMDVIRAALKTQPQIRHRLEVFRTPGAPTIIDDAYNSNPVGFASALKLLDLLVAPGGRRILVTPGMVELGAAHDEKHAELGVLAAEYVDVALLVTPERMRSFERALYQANTAEILTFPRQADAEAWVRAHAVAGDVVLYENNLPDLYEQKVRF